MSFMPWWFSIIVFSSSIIVIFGICSIRASSELYTQVARRTVEAPSRNCGKLEKSSRGVSHCTYMSSHGEVEEDETRQTAQNHADANSKVLGDIVCVENAES
jgi:hypothetical protein